MALPPAREWAGIRAEVIMSIPGQHRTRGRPPGSVKPAEQRRQRKDYRLSPVALATIGRGRLLLTSDSSVPTETAFIEAAIRQYVAFLSGDVLQRERETQEIEQMQARISDLEHDLHTTKALLDQAQAEIRALKARPQAMKPAEPAPSVATRRKPSYQIVLKHEGAVCPALPDGFSYRDTSPDQCPVHEVFSRACPIDHARRALERLKTVPGLTQIWLTKNGYATDRDFWKKEKGQWVRE